MRLECGGCGKEIPTKDAEYYDLHVPGREPILKPCKECLQKALEGLRSYPPYQAKKN